MRRTAKAAIVLLGASLVAAACGGDNKNQQQHHGGTRDHERRRRHERRRGHHHRRGRRHHRRRQVGRHDHLLAARPLHLVQQRHGGGQPHVEPVRHQPGHPERLVLRRQGRDLDQQGTRRRPEDERFAPDRRLQVQPEGGLGGRLAHRVRRHVPVLDRQQRRRTRPRTAPARRSRSSPRRRHRLRPDQQGRLLRRRQDRDLHLRHAVLGLARPRDRPGLRARPRGGGQGRAGLGGRHPQGVRGRTTPRR